MNIFELSEIADQSIYVTWSHRHRMAWRASFGSNVVTEEPMAKLPNDGMGNGIEGFGKTPQEALSDFAKKIRGKAIKLRHSSDGWAYINIPKDLAVGTPDSPVVCAYQIVEA